MMYPPVITSTARVVLGRNYSEKERKNKEKRKDARAMG